MRNKFFAALLAAALTLTGAGASLAGKALKTVPGDVLVVFENPTGAKVSAASLAAAAGDKPEGEHRAYAVSVASSVGARVAMTYDSLSEAENKIVALVHSDTQSETELMAALRAQPGVKGASLNYVSYPTATPNDRYYSVYPDAEGKLWGLKAINAPEVWDKLAGSSEAVYAAVIDSGIDPGHEDLTDVVAREYSKSWFYEGEDNHIVSSDAEDDYQDRPVVGHGTHVSGTIAAMGNNAAGVVGVAGQGVGGHTRIITLKSYAQRYDFYASWGFYDDLTILAMEEACRLKKAGVNIAAVNMSIGGWHPGTPDDVSNEGNAYWLAMRNLSDLGIVICVAAGNEGQRVGHPAPCDDLDEGRYEEGDYRYPASYRNIPNMLVVAGANQELTRSLDGDGEAFSNYGSEYVDIAAPGAQIVSTVPRDFVLPGSIPLSENEDPSYAFEVVEPGVDDYANWGGTSMATPHVAGAVALLKSAYPNATGAQIKKAILEGCDKTHCTNDRDSVTYDDDLTHVSDDTSKYGFLDVKKAYDLLPSIIAEDEPKKSSSSSSGCDVALGGLGLISLLGRALLIKRR